MHPALSSGRLLAYRRFRPMVSSFLSPRASRRGRAGLKIGGVLVAWSLLLRLSRVKGLPYGEALINKTDVLHLHSRRSPSFVYGIGVGRFQVIQIALCGSQIYIGLTDLRSLIVISGVSSPNFA